MEQKEQTIQWHPAFFAGIQIELGDEAKYFSFEAEHQLGTKPMEIDVLVKKEKERRIRKNIGRIFRTHNVIEYKSPTDYLSVDDFYKVYGYACFYKSDVANVDSISIEDLTISVFIDTLLICSSTAMMLLVSGVEGKSGVLDGIPYVQAAISSNVGQWGIHFITFSIFAFAFSSLVGNYFYAESNILFIKNNKTLLFVFRITCIVAIFLGAQADFSLVWNLADVTMGLMAIVNIIAIFLLSGTVVKVLNDYEKQKKQGIKPVFHEKNVGIKNTVWK